MAKSRKTMTPDPALMKCRAVARAVMSWERTINEAIRIASSSSGRR
jgi:hypothetical protein